jgi:hypothetical protein
MKKGQGLLFPQTARDIGADRTRDGTIEEIAPIQHWWRCGSTRVLILVGMGADVGANHSVRKDGVTTPADWG